MKKLIKELLYKDKIHIYDSYTNESYTVSVLGFEMYYEIYLNFVVQTITKDEHLGFTHIKKFKNTISVNNFILKNKLPIYKLLEDYNVKEYSLLFASTIRIFIENNKELRKKLSSKELFIYIDDYTKYIPFLEKVSNDNIVIRLFILNKLNREVVL